MRARMKPIIPRTLLFDPEKMHRTIEDALDDAAKEVRKDFDITVQSWDTHVPFKTYSRAYERTISTNNAIYFFVNNGTKKHRIAARNKKFLAFMMGGSAKTAPGVFSSGAGHPGSVLVFAKRIMHPGIKPRKFNKIIRDKWLNELPRRLQRAINDAVK